MREQEPTAVYPQDLKVGDRIAPHGDAVDEYQQITRITSDGTHFCVYTDVVPDYPILYTHTDLVRVLRPAPGPRQPLDEMRAEIEQDRKEIARLRIVVAQLTRYVQEHVLSLRDDAELRTIMAEAEKAGE